jgi:hypothetical protein
MTLRPLGQVLVTVLLFLAAQTTAGEVPLDAAGFTGFVAQAYGKALPEARIRVLAPLRIDIVQRASANVAMLDKTWQRCQQVPADCDAAVAERVATDATTIRAVTVPFGPASLRAVIRPAADVTLMQDVSGIDASLAPVAKLLAGDLWIVCVKETPGGVVSLRLRDLAPLKLDPEQALALALQNLQAMLEPLADFTPRIARGGIRHMRGTYYESSRLLLSEQWASLARQLPGGLYVAVPAAEVVLVTDTPLHGAASVMQTEAHAVIRTAQHPISETVLRWSGTGWEVAPR